VVLVVVVVVVGVVVENEAECRGARSKEMRKYDRKRFGARSRHTCVGETRVRDNEGCPNLEDSQGRMKGAGASAEGGGWEGDSQYARRGGDYGVWQRMAHRTREGTREVRMGGMMMDGKEGTIQW
jgi:hypothetical protein